MEEKLWHKHKWPEGVPHSLEYPDIPLFQVLEDSAKNYPNNTYTIFQGRGTSFSTINEMTDKVANFLASRGIKKGDRVGIFLPNTPHYPVAFFGILKAGAVCVTCNPQYTPSELNYQLNDAGVKAVFALDHPTLYDTTCEALEGTKVETVVICSGKDFLSPLKAVLGGILGKIPKAKQHLPGHVKFGDLVKQYEPNPPKVDIKPEDDLALIIYTSGTTGRPKGAMVTHRNFVSNLIAAVEWIRIEDEDGKFEPMRVGEECYLGILPFYHSYGLTLVMLQSCYLASKVVCVPDPRAGDPPFTEALELVQKHQCTTIHGVPPIYAALLNHPQINEYDLSTIRACASGAAPLPIELAKKFEAKTGTMIFEGYGLSETSPVTHVNPTYDPGRKFGSIGLPISDTDAKILDLETGTKELPIGEDGEIALSGPQVMKGYWDKPEVNKEIFRQINGKRFFLTGDIGHIDEEGFFIITDRKKDMINVGGLKAWPREIEEVFYAHPAVVNAAAIGVPDSEGVNEVVKVFIQPKPGVTVTEEEIIEFSKDKLAAYKRPKFVEFRDELPMTLVGKILRRELREE